MKADKRKNNTKSLNQKKKKYTCYDCKWMMSSEHDDVCWIWCSITDRDFTFSGSDDTICKDFEKDY